MKKTKLAFSNRFFQSHLYSDTAKLKLKDWSIVNNLDSKPISLNDGSQIHFLKSYLLQDYSFNSPAKKVLVTKLKFDPTTNNKSLNNFCIKNWDNSKIRYPDNPEKWNAKILRSPISKIDNLEFVCWYLPSQTASSIHNEHPFPKEVHTQIYGLGIMNKFKQKSLETIYQKMYMPPGFTHDPFYDVKNIYPWHQYEAISASIWMAIIYH